MSVRYIESSRLPTQWGDFDMHGFEDAENNKEHVVLTMGDISGDEPLLVRIHSECLTGDALFSLRCDCGNQLRAAMQAIASQGRGAIFYLRQEGRGIGLVDKLRAYQLQDSGMDTVEANLAIGHQADARDYGIGAAILRSLGVGSVRLLTNNPDKIDQLKRYGMPVAERVALQPTPREENLRYLATKVEAMRHDIELPDASARAESD